MTWQIKLTGTDQQNLKIFAIYGGNYFPRNFYYKKEAEKCLDRVRDLGGNAKIEKMK